MDTWRRRTAYYLVTLGAVMLVYTVAYHWGMVALEGETVTFLHSAQVVVETFTTTGFGSDAPWTTPGMNLLVIAMDLTGVLLIFMALPVLVFPLFEETLTRSVPTSVDLEDHVIICGYSPRGRALVDELRARDREYVVVEPDRDRADELFEETDLSIVHGDPESEATLDAVNLSASRAIVADLGDEANASIALAVQDADLPVVTFAEDEAVADYHRYAGADEAFLPRQLIGESLARKVTAGISPAIRGRDADDAGANADTTEEDDDTTEEDDDTTEEDDDTDERVGDTREKGEGRLADAVEIGENFDIVELPVQSGSELAGLTVAESEIRERTGTNIIGAWFRGEFVTPPPPEALIDEQTILVAAGREEQLERLKELTRSERRRHRRGRVLVAGYGKVGSTVATRVSSAGLETVVVDRREAPGVDVVGDVTDEETLQAAGIDDADTVILALSDDTETVFATLVVREVNPEVEVIARADSTGSVGKLYRAGADYVLALSTVAGRMLASTVLDEEVISFDIQIELVRMDCGDLAGRSLADADVRARTGVTVLAIERDGERITELSPEFVVESGDDLVVAGTDEAINKFAAFVE